MKEMDKEQDCMVVLTVKTMEEDEEFKEEVKEMIEWVLGLIGDQK